MAPVLEVIEGPDAGRVAELGSGLVIGRDAGADLTLDDTQVSRRHAHVSTVSGGFVIEDLGSSNGTFVNGTELSGRTRLYPGDQLVLGTTVIQLLNERAAPANSGVLPVPPGLAKPAGRPDFTERLVDSAQPPPAATGTKTLDSLVDRRVRAQARLAPLALLALAALVVVIFIVAK
jgi:S-DNA-T family DNA segregation ATPase FtsK/SpoIIIE